MRRFAVLLAVLTLLALLVPQAEAHHFSNVKYPLIEPSNPIGEVQRGFANVQMHGNHVLRLVVALKKVEPNSVYTVWLVNCADAPGGHPCFPGPLNNVAPFGAFSPSPPCFGGGPGTGPLATLKTNPAGNANTAAIKIDMSAVDPGEYYFHFDIGPGVCHPGGGVPPGFIVSEGFTITV